MKANDYQEQASRTLLEKPDFEITDKQIMISWNALGLAGEAGEVADLIKKGIYHQQGIDKTKLKKELGDVLWYIQAICRDTDLTLAEVMESNLIKLNARFPDGYNPQDSTNRKGEAA